MPARDEQRRIADFLDDRVARIDQIIAARRLQIQSLASIAARRAYDAVRGSGRPGTRRDSGLSWLGDVPASWAVLPVGTEFSVELGKMLNESRQTGDQSIPYLRNTNVQWDHIDLHDLKSMDIAPAEYARYTVEPGDLLILEGGQPGRAALYDGGIQPLGFQKALHRARSRGRSHNAWLLECLRVATQMNVFAVSSGQTTIGHLTNEQLRAQRFPFPPPEEQLGLTEELTGTRTELRSASAALARSIDLLTDYKTSLITAAVTGDLDVTTAGSGMPG